MGINTLSRHATAALAIAALAGPFPTGSAQATPILSFGQTGNGNTIIGTQSGTSTTITATNAPITISQIDAAAATPLDAYLNMSFTSSSVATSIMGNLEEHFSGSFSMTSGLNSSGVNYLSATLIDIAFGSNAAFNLNASTPPAGNVSFTSALIPAADLGVDRGAGLSFANVTPLLTIVDTTFSSFTSSASGTFSGDLTSPGGFKLGPPVVTAEPASLALLSAGVAGLGLIRRRRAEAASS